MDKKERIAILLKSILKMVMKNLLRNISRGY